MKTISLAVMVLGLLSGTARGNGLLLSPDQLPAETRETFAQQIRSARAENPKPFDALATVRENLPMLDAGKRGRMVPLSRMLKSMGADAYLPVVEELAFRSRGVSDLAPSAALAWKVGMLETIGNLRDPRSEPLLSAVLASDLAQEQVVRAAAEALGKLETDSAAKTLVGLVEKGGGSDGTDSRRIAVLVGMGSCRRLVAARALAEALEDIADEPTAKRVIKALGDVGNAWAWRTPAVKHRDEEAAVRRTAAEALVAAFVRYQGEARQAASNALMVVDAPITAKLIDEAKQSADQELRVALDGLAARFARNPTR